MTSIEMRFLQQKSASQLQLKDIRRRPIRPAGRRVTAKSEEAAATADIGQQSLKLVSMVRVDGQKFGVKQ